MNEEFDELENRFSAAEQQGRIIVEDDYGMRYTVVRAYAIGTKTEDPGFVIRIKEDPR